MHGCELDDQYQKDGATSSFGTDGRGIVMGWSRDGHRMHGMVTGWSRDDHGMQEMVTGWSRDEQLLYRKDGVAAARGPSATAIT